MSEQCRYCGQGSGNVNGGLLSGPDGWQCYDFHGCRAAMAAKVTFLQEHAKVALKEAERIAELERERDAAIKRVDEVTEQRHRFADLLDRAVHKAEAAERFCNDTCAVVAKERDAAERRAAEERERAERRGALLGRWLAEAPHVKSWSGNGEILVRETREEIQ